MSVVTPHGLFDTDYFTPTIDLPQTASMEIGRIVEEPIVAREQVVSDKNLALSRTFDHRIIDAAPVVRWLQQFADFVRIPYEQP